MLLKSKNPLPFKDDTLFGILTLWPCLGFLWLEQLQKCVTQINTFGSCLLKNPTCGTHVVWPGMLFPNSCGNKAAVNLHLKLKSMKVLSDLSLHKSSFLVIAYIRQQTFCSKDLWNGNDGQKSSESGLSLAYLPPVACQNGGPKHWSFGQNVSFNQNSQQIVCCCMSNDVHLIMVDHTQLGTELSELEMRDLLHEKN